jgi:hypothetical protein
MNKYAALTEYLDNRTDLSFNLSFSELDRIVDLPPSAKKHPAWWANSRNAHAHAATWLDAGFNATPDFVTGRVRFQRGGDRGRGIGGSKMPRGLFL